MPLADFELVQEKIGWMVSHTQLFEEQGVEPSGQERAASTGTPSSTIRAGECRGG
ncbi:MAG: hypothetical protein QOC77_585 [Thermoleophilaceae bacterium]|nr:hypothetical protein [Thermoleophilaceae bacterium]